MFLNKYSIFKFIFYMFDLCHYQTYSLSLKNWGKTEIQAFNEKVSNIYNKSGN